MTCSTSRVSSVTISNSEGNRDDVRGIAVHIGARVVAIASMRRSLLADYAGLRTILKILRLNQCGVRIF
jgi:hypothetical protein